MKLFVSWSQDISRQIAQDFRDWLPLVNQTIEPFMSEDDTDKGAHWSSTIRRELEQSAFGIVILTAENIDSTWLHFEAGAIAKSVEEGRVVPILFGLKHSDVGLRYYFFSNEGQPPEPPHIHVKGGGRDAKIWLEPEISIADSYGFNHANFRISCERSRRAAISF